ncbi:MAG: universal stress protein [Candidatus Syntrophonatronum acetioxidans]|uniref:Universal stress protein n=1 Tax=Candidatus Syntrophonatronum acetioxidans TaxID=1795816 RepID=A0A424YG92_9FIRM|nr:MAG: universal stress protein [Candidatus Syntrophonatronum acetioxidans]
MFKKVLLSYDFSQPSEELFSFLEELQEFGAGEVILSHVIDNGIRPRQVIEETKKCLSSMVKGLEEKGFKTQLEIPIGSPAEEVIRLANREKVSLILIGSRGKSKIKEMMLGSIAANVIRMSEVPVFLDKYRKRNDDYETMCPQKFCKILYPTDFSDPSWQVYEKIKELLKIKPEKFNEIVLCHVVDEGETEEDIQGRKEKAREKLEKMKGDLEALGPRVKIFMEVGVPSENINKIADEEKVTLTMIASRGKGGFKELLLGSTAENVARRSRRPVMLFPFR